MRPALLVALLAVTACGGGSTDYFDRPTAEAALALASRGCDGIFECGVIEIECDPVSGAYQPGTAAYQTQELCEMALNQDYSNTLAGCTAVGLTQAQIDDINECFNQDQDCLSADDLMQYAITVCNEQPVGTEACQRASAVLDDCRTCYDFPDEPICDGV